MTSMWIKSCSCWIEQTTIGVPLLGTKKIHFQDLLHALVDQSKSDFIVVVFLKTIMKKSLVFDLEFELTGVQCMICEAARCIFPKLIFNFQQELDFFCSQSRHLKGRPLKTTSFKTSLKDMYYYKLADFPIAHPSLFLQILTSIWEDRPNTTLRCDLCKTRPSKMEVSPSKSAQNGQKMQRVANLKKIYLKLFLGRPV